MNDPLALSPEVSGQQSPGAVPALPRFTHRDAQGNVIAQSTAPEGTTITDLTKWYYCPIPNTSFHRKDGKRLVFVQFVFSTNIKQDQTYLDAEIEEQHPYLRYATAEEVEIAKMRMDAKGTIRENFVKELADDPAALEALEAQIAAMKLAKEKGMTADEIKIAGAGAQKGAAIKTDTASITLNSPASSFQAAVVGSDKVSSGAAQGNVGTGSLGLKS